MCDSFFSSTYSEARRRFVDASDAIGADHSSHPIGDHDDLSIDVAVIGEKEAPAIVVSSGVHGVEGFVGSAIQLSLLDRLAANGPGGIKYVLIHAVNPYGFEHIRRFNEEGIDLNRNFHRSDESYSGAAEAYVQLNDFLNPASPPSRTEVFTLKALWLIWQNGMSAMKEAVARGQYEYPRGLFYGGSERSESFRIVRRHCDDWIGDSKDVIHFDVHSGLGKFADYKLLIGESDSQECAWYEKTFGSEVVESLTRGGMAYTVSGLFCDWMKHHFGGRRYRSLGIEFGTYNVIRVLAAIRAENRAHHYAGPGEPCFQRAKSELLECFLSPLTSVAEGNGGVWTSGDPPRRGRSLSQFETDTRIRDRVTAISFGRHVGGYVEPLPAPSGGKQRECRKRPCPRDRTQNVSGGLE